ncbi:sulfotransferase [Caulobacter sp. KR2-114]|uniref:tetratricopeptide repeat-containing sulfotransferase family protein n=1 Tax=Caulobacter sp. KR2-114 TaxID=3400912 RepID=UPI003C007947
MNRQTLALSHIEEGLRHLEAGALEQARLAFETAGALSPNLADAYYHLARTLVLQARREEAEAAARAGLQSEPRHPGCAHILGLIMAEGERLSEGLVWLRVAHEGAPGHAQVARDLGVVELFLGHLDDARQHLMAAIKLDVQAHEVLFNLVRITDMSAPTEEVELLMSGMRRLAGQTEPPLDPKLAIQVFYGLAKAYEDRGEPDEAFAWLQRANRARRAAVDYDCAAHIRRLERTAEIFDAGRIAALAGAGQMTDRPIFVVGMPRSGTTLVEQIISAHPDVYGAGETPTLLNILVQSTGPGGAPFPEWGANMLPPDCLNLGGAYLNNLPAGPASQTRTTDKRLENAEFLGLVHLMLPNAPIVYVRRDPRDMAFSCYALLFSEGQDWSYDFADLAAYWRAHEALMAHWKAVLPPGRILEVSYEALVADLDTEVRRIIEHCGLAWDSACLDFHRSRRGVRSASAAQVRQPIYDTSIGRWRPFAAHLQPLFDAMGLPPETEVARTGSGRAKAKGHADKV